MRMVGSALAPWSGAYAFARGVVAGGVCPSGFDLTPAPRAQGLADTDIDMFSATDFRVEYSRVLQQSPDFFNEGISTAFYIKV